MPSEFTVCPVAWDDADSERLRAAQRAEIEQRYGDPDSEPGQVPSAADITVVLLARDASGAAVGCGALRQLGESLGEVKRMYVPPEHRGRGIARHLLAALEDHARELGWSTLRLETGDRLGEAIGLYTSAGYRRIDNYGPYAGVAASLCFERDLRADSGRSTGRGYAPIGT